MTFALTASKALEAQEFEAGVCVCVAIHTPRGDGNSYDMHL